MLTVHFLGTGAALPGFDRDNTSLALDDGTEVTLVDTSGSPLKRLSDAGIPPDRLSRVIITHEHLDHTFGYASLIQSLWLAGRKVALDVYAQPATWRVLDGLAELYRVGRWKDAFAIRKNLIEPGERPFVEADGFTIRAGRGKHSVPSVGLRFESPAGTLVYSSDTSSPCDEIRELATGADVLVHEATFLAGQEEAAVRFGHSTSRQAAEVAVAAGVQRLVLIHFTPSGRDDLASLRQGAESTFRGQIEVPSDLDRLILT